MLWLVVVEILLCLSVPATGAGRTIDIAVVELAARWLRGTLVLDSRGEKKKTYRTREDVASVK